MAPGPAISGMASGKAATLRMWSWVIAVSAVAALRAVRSSNTISKAIQNSSRPPAMRKAGRLMPIAFSTKSPPKPKNAMMPKAMMQARTATWRCSALFMPRVTERKIGARPGGSMVTSSVTSVDEKKSASIAAPLQAAILAQGRAAPQAGTPSSAPGGEPTLPGPPQEAAGAALPKAARARGGLPHAVPSAAGRLGAAAPEAIGDLHFNALIVLVKIRLQRPRPGWCSGRRWARPERGRFEPRQGLLSRSTALAKDDDKRPGGGPEHPHGDIKPDLDHRRDAPLLSRLRHERDRQPRACPTCATA